MTLTSLRPRSPVASVDAAVAVVRARGLRLSAARRIVLEALFAAEGPVSAEQVAGGLGGRVAGLDLTSVYRNLETFEEIGLVRHVHLGHGPGLYAIAGETQAEYLLCESCSAVRTIPPGELDAVRSAVFEATGFKARFSHFPIAGVCGRCTPVGADAPG